MNDQHAQERNAAGDWYKWLWISPILTVFTTLNLYRSDFGIDLFCGGTYGDCYYDYDLVDRVSILIAIMGSALWHLVLLIPALDKRREFVRWHGRQALFLAGIRTVVPVGFALLSGLDGALSSIPFLVGIWFFGTRWGQGQAKNGKCSLARWFGQEVSLPLPQPDTPPDQPINQLAGDVRINTLVNVAQYDIDRDRIKAAVGELQKNGLAAAAFGATSSSGKTDSKGLEAASAIEVIRQSMSKEAIDKAVRDLEKMDGLVEPF